MEIYFLRLHRRSTAVKRFRLSSRFRRQIYENVSLHPLSQINRCPSLRSDVPR